MIDAAYDVRIGKKLAPPKSRPQPEWEMVYHVRLVLARVLALLFAASWIVFPGFGAIDLSVTWSSGLAAGARGGLGSLLHGARRRPVRRHRGAAAFGGSGRTAGGRDDCARRVGRRRPRGISHLGPGRARGRDARRRMARRSSWRSWRRRAARSPDVALVALGIVPWLAYAVDMWAANREGRPDSDITNGIDHYAVQGALGLALAVLPPLAALRPALTPLAPSAQGSRPGTWGSSRSRGRTPAAGSAAPGRRPRWRGASASSRSRSRPPSAARAERRSTEQRLPHSALRRRSSPSRIRSSPNSNSGFSAGSGGAMCSWACSTM